jgi:hypothetical protein
MGHPVQLFKEAVDNGQLLFGAASAGECPLDNRGDVPGKDVREICVIDFSKIGCKRRQALQRAIQLMGDDGLVQTFVKGAVFSAHRRELARRGV